MGSKQPRRWRRRILWAILLVAALALAWLWRPLTARGVTAASYGARIACSCRFVAGRTLSDCRRDFEPGMGVVVLSEDVEAKSVTAWFPLISRQTATFRQGQGCELERWES
jgi:hypothetical protein